MNDIPLKLTERTVGGKKLAKLRKEGFVPSVVYGGKAEPILTQSPMVATLKAVQTAGKHTPVNLMIGSKKRLAIIKDIDTDPVRHELRHIAFHAIKQTDVITTEVPIVLIGQGESAAERAGLVILQAIGSIEIKAKPADLPKSLELSIANLATEDDKLTIADLVLPTGVEFDDVDQDMELVIANVYEPSALQAANEAAGGEAEAEVAEVESENGDEGTASGLKEESKQSESESK